MQVREKPLNLYDNIEENDDCCNDEDFGDSEAIKIVETLNLNRKKLYKNI
jgi:hypothetical protein